MSKKSPRLIRITSFGSPRIVAVPNIAQILPRNDDQTLLVLRRGSSVVADGKFEYFAELLGLGAQTEAAHTQIGGGAQ